jgi:hypothetical protein
LIEVAPGQWPEQEPERNREEPFYLRLAELTAVLIALRGRVHVTADFTYTADRLALFLRRFAEVKGLRMDVSRIAADQDQQRLPLYPRRDNDHSMIEVVIDVDLESAGTRGEPGSFDRFIYFAPFARIADHPVERTVVWNGLMAHALPTGYRVGRLDRTEHAPIAGD